MKTECLLARLQQPISRPYPVPDESSLGQRTVHFSIIISTHTDVFETNIMTEAASQFYVHFMQLLQTKLMALVKEFLRIFLRHSKLAKEPNIPLLYY
jgi:hypothetical protein